MFTFLLTAGAIGLGGSYVALLVKGNMVENNKDTFFGLTRDQMDTLAKPAKAVSKKIGGN
jgi:hypothetical protein